MADVKKLSETVDKISELIAKVNDEVWSYGEVYFKEFKSSRRLAEACKENGFSVDMGICGIPTAFVCKWGEKGPKIGILAEYDALDGLNQRRGTDKKGACRGHSESDPGHGCGHNSLGAGSMGAAIALKNYCAENGVDAQIYFFGCPAEENGSGKVFMARDGVFDDMDICITWHPDDNNGVLGTSSLACISVKYEFHGVASHAAAVPHLGRSALDACELMNVGANYLREHIIPEARMHYSYLNTGSKAPNVVQDFASTFYFVRAPKTKQAFEILERLDDVAKGAALMTGTKVTITHMDGLSDYVPNETLGKVMEESFREIGLPEYTREEKEMAKAYSETFDQKSLEDKRRELCRANRTDKNHYDNVYIDDLISPYVHSPQTVLPGSTDVGDVSYCAPTAQFWAATVAIGTPGHSWQMTGQGAVEYAHKGTVNAAKVLALTALKVIENPRLLQEIKREHKENVPDGYICPTDPDFMPEL